MVNIALWILLSYVLVINVVTFILYGVDKWKSRRAAWRIPEATLIRFALWGGSIGALIGIRVWHHKTLHAKFRYGIPAILLLHIALTVAIVYFSTPST